MKKVLLALCFNSQNGPQYESIINKFQEKGFDIQEFSGLDEKRFHFDILGEILFNLKLNYPEGIERLVVLSDVKEAIFVWFRAYNSMVDDFILYINGAEINAYKNVVDTEIFIAIANFVGIEIENILGKIFIVSDKNYLDENLAAHLLRGNNFKYFNALEKIDLDRNFKKNCNIKMYYFRNKTYTPFLNETNENEKFNNCINLDGAQKPQLELTEEKLCNVFYQDTYIFFILISGIYKLTPLSLFKLCFNLLHKLKDADMESKKQLINLFTDMVKSDCSFVERAHIYSWISVLKDSDWIFYEPVV